MEKESSACNESDGNYVPFLSELEIQVLRDLDESIGHFEENSDEASADEPATSPGDVPATRSDDEPATSFAEPAALFSLHRAQMFSKPRHLNAGYVIVDGTDMRFITNEPRNPNLAETAAFTTGNTVVDDGLGNSASSLVRPLSEANLNVSSEDLLAADFLRSCQAPARTDRGFPARTFLSRAQQFSIFVTGMATTAGFSGFYVSLAFFSDFLGVFVLSSVGLSYFTASLVTSALVFCSKKRAWIPVLPAVPLCFALMAAIAVAMPTIVAAEVSLPSAAILGMVTVTGLCSGLSGALVSRLAVLFPGAKTGALVTYGRGLGTLAPALIQIVLILCQDFDPEEEARRRYKTLCFYILFALVSILQLAGLVSLLKFSRSGIYELFAGKDCAAPSPKNITIGTVFGMARRRFRRIRCYVLLEFLAAAVSYYVLSQAPRVHAAAVTTESSLFWGHYLGTVLVGLFILGNWLGEVTALCRCSHSPSRVCLPVVYIIASIIRLGFVPASAVILARRPFPQHLTIFVMTLFFLLALSNGFLAVAMSSHCQSLCGARARDTCPVVSQLITLSVLLGSVAGAALSFLPLT